MSSKREGEETGCVQNMASFAKAAWMKDDDNREREFDMRKDSDPTVSLHSRTGFVIVVMIDFL